MSRAHERYRRQTDGRAIAYSERELTFAKNQHNPIKTVGRDSFLSPQTPKNTSFLRVTQPPGVAQPPYSRGHN